MVKNLEGHNKKIIQELTPYINKPGIALSFDDSYRVNGWYKYCKDMFGYYDVKVTFNINGVNPLENDRKHTQEEVDKLLELQSNGHEIAHHGYKHMRATEYSTKYSYKKWIEDEIEQLNEWMKEQSHSKTREKFKRPVSFAFPHFLFEQEIISRIVPKYFKVTRGHLKDNNLIPFGHVGFAPSICLDGYYGCNLYYLKRIIRQVKQTGKNLILTCHSILPSETEAKNIVGDRADKWNNWKVTPELIQSIINEVRKNGMEFYTTSEIAGVATFIDKNLETAIRECISCPKDKWILIKDLIQIEELDLSNKNISNLDGIQYLLNLERLNLTNNKINNFGLLKKLPKLKELSIEKSKCLA